MGDKMTSKVEPKLLAWGITVVFLAGGGWMSVTNLGERVTKLETKQDEVSKDIRNIMVTQSAICVATNAACQ
jgi:hypothetical protein